MTQTFKPDALMPFGKHQGRTVSSIAREAPGYLLWFCTLTKARANQRLCAALAAHLPDAMLNAAKADRDRIERQEAEAAARRARRASWLALQAALADPEAIA